ncbi:MAG: N-acetylmuramoyl-L-alanine amidase [Verrucomicrobiae bacterium]
MREADGAGGHMARGRAAVKGDRPLIPREDLLLFGVRKQWLILWVLASIALAASPLRAELSEEEKKQMFLQSREDIRPVPKASATPRPKPKPAATPRPTPKPKPATKKPAPPAEEQAPRQKPAPEPEETPASKPAAKHAAEAKPEATPNGPDDFISLPGEVPGLPQKPRPSATPAPASSPVQTPQGTTPEGRPLDAPILVEKSGLEKDQGLEPAPAMQFGGFFKRYRYLTPSVRRAIDSARVQRGRWKYIIIHNSGTRQGNARIFDVYHRRVRKMQNGLAYHFVIGNGNSSGNGEIEIGDRWKRQINGGHVASDYLNNIAIGICLVGDLNLDLPTKDQLAAIDELVTYLRGRVGRINGKQAIVEGHKEINPKPTDCPGDRFPLRWLHQRFR